MPLTSRARELRRTATPAERVLWRVLRDRAAGAKARRQVPCGPYVLDFLFPSAGLAIEVDGDTHAMPSAVQSDAERDAFLAQQGIHVLRFGNRDVLNNLDGVLQAIIATLATLPVRYPEDRVR